VRWQ